MSKINTAIQLLKKERKGIPVAIFNNMIHAGLFDRMRDDKFLKLSFKIKMGRKLDLENPQTFNEKLQWLKLHDRNPEHTMMVDKYLVRDFVKSKIGEEYLVPLIGVWDRVEDIDFDSLPNKFVLKCNHDSGGLCICRDKASLDIEKAKQKLENGLKTNLYPFGREWPYKNVPRKIICEQLIEDYTGAENLTDYKFFCFDGKVDCVMACIERNTGHPKFYYFDKDWKLLRNYNVPGQIAPPDFTLPKPEHYDDMIRIAEILSVGQAHVRVDLYSSCGKIYFGELTFFSDSGFDKDMSDFLDHYWGNLLILPSKTI